MVALVILDGFGIGTDGSENAIKYAKTPNLDFLKSHYPYVMLNASGLAVGIDDGQMGNSECGHINLGAGRIVKQNSVRLDEMIESGNFETNLAIVGAIKHAKENNSNLHIMGLYSKGGVHSKIKHAMALIKFAERNGVNTYLDLFTDGRDRPTDEGKSEFLELEKNLSSAKISSISGRIWAMDRENRFDRVQKAYNALTRIGDVQICDNLLEYFDENYSKGVFDEFLPPVALVGGEPIKDGDSVVFFNFRTDRPREITSAFTSDDFSGFERKQIKNLYFATMTNYSADLKNVHVILENEVPTPPLGKILEDNNKTQFRVSETTKYAHVTFFFNGEREEPYKGEDRVLVPTRDVLSFDQDPKMRAEEITSKLCEAMSSKKYDFLLANITNGDMVGHTGNFDAAVIAVKTIDECIKKIYQTAIDSDCELIITADHGNIEKMMENGKKHTAHTTNPVPLYFVTKNHKQAEMVGDLPISCVAPTILKLLDINVPDYMSTQSFLKKM